MAIINTSYKIIPISSGTLYTGNDLGNGVTGATVNQIFCLTPGTIIINAFGGGTAAFPMTAGQVLDIFVGSCSAITGTYAALKPAFQNPGIGAISWGSNP